MLQPGRQFKVTTAGKYRYGFNGKENDNDAKLDQNNNEITGGVQDYGMRIYDPMIGRFFSVDPLAANYPWYTPYQFGGNNPIRFIDLDGAEEYDPQGDPFFLAKLATTTFYDIKHSAENLFMNTFIKPDPGKKWLATYKLNKDGEQVFETVIIQVPKQGVLKDIANDALDVVNVVAAGKLKISDGTMIMAKTDVKTQLIKVLKTAEELKSILKVENKLVNGIKEYYKITAKLATGERVATFKKTAAEYANLQGWSENIKLNKLNKGRTIYSDNLNNHYSVDTQHGSFEVLNSKGKHQGEIDFAGQNTKPADKSGSHDIKVK